MRSDSSIAAAPVMRNRDDQSIAAAPMLRNAAPMLRNNPQVDDREHSPSPEPHQFERENSPAYAVKVILLVPFYIFLDIVEQESMN